MIALPILVAVGGIAVLAVSMSKKRDAIAPCGPPYDPGLTPELAAQVQALITSPSVTADMLRAHAASARANGFPRMAACLEEVAGKRVS